MKRSLADELADLANPKPTNLEDDDLGDGPTLLDSDNELEDLSPRKRQRIGLKNALPLRADVQLDGEEYKGRPISSGAAFGSQSLSDETEGDEDSLEGSSDSEDPNPAQQNTVQERRQKMQKRHRKAIANGKQNGDLAEEDVSSGSEREVLSSAEPSGDSSGPEEDNEDRSGNDSGASELDNARPESEEDEGWREQQASEAAALSRLKDRLAKDRQRAEAVKHQHAVWDKLLEIRILLQKDLLASYKFPQPETSILETGPALQSSVVEDMQSTLRDLGRLHTSLCRGNSEIATSIPDLAAQEKRFEAAGVMEWADLDSLYSGLTQFKNASLDRWYRKTLLTSGTAALQSNLKIFNQSISAQVKTTMQGSEKAMRSACLSKAEAPRKLFSSTSPVDQEGHDAECYADAQFYQQLLKQFLESRGANTSQTQPASKQKKQKSNRDRRASKGRRLRYDVQEKLVNFMAATRYEEPPMASQLFRNLFGQRT